MIPDKVGKMFRSLILGVMISFFMAAILTVLIWTQPQFMEMLIHGGPALMLPTFFGLWGISVIMAYICMSCARKRPTTIPSELMD